MDLRHGGRAQEADAELRPSQGAVPQYLAGTLYRNGAGNHLSDSVIDGDGLVSAVTFTPGSPAHLRSRHVRTASYRASLKAPGADATPVRLAGADAAGGRLRDLPLRPAASRASTSVAMIDGRLLALRERDMPWELEPGTLTAGTTNIVVFDAQSVADGPACTLPVPESLGFTFHGQWVHA